VKIETAEAEIRGRVERWLQAVLDRNIDAISSHYAPDILAFDAVSQLQFKGVDAYRKHWEACHALCPGPMLFEIHDLSTEAGDDVAFCHALNRCGSAGENGEEKAGWMRMTACYRRLNEQWKIVHEHCSLPFDPNTSQAVFTLEP
jgi:ketosteroid isomerase-like protein